jgi:hypothetical protein
MYRKQYPSSTCGVDDHDPECLCDVIVDKPVEVMRNWGRDSFMVQRLIEEMGLSQGLKPGDLLRLLELQTMLHDDVVAYNERVAEGSSPNMNEEARKLSTGRMRHVEQMHEDGWDGRQIRTYAMDMWNLALSRGHVSHIILRAERRKARNENSTDR